MGHGSEGRGVSKVKYSFEVERRKRRTHQSELSPFGLFTHSDLFAVALRHRLACDMCFSDFIITLHAGSG